MEGVAVQPARYRQLQLLNLVLTLAHTDDLSRINESAQRFVGQAAVPEIRFVAELLGDRDQS